MRFVHVRDFLALLRAGRNSDDDLAFMRYLRIWPLIGPKKAAKIVSAIVSSEAKKVIEILEDKL